MPQQREAQPENADASNMHGHVLVPEEMEEIRSDIRTMVTLSWITSVLKDLGSPSHGKIKADQWHVLGTTYLPVSLVRLWVKVHKGDKRSEQCRKILDMTISLLSAVIIASS